jgi:hypothetical protein
MLKANSTLPFAAGNPVSTKPATSGLCQELAAELYETDPHHGLDRHLDPGKARCTAGLENMKATPQ